MARTIYSAGAGLSARHVSVKHQWGHAESQPAMALYSLVPVVAADAALFMPGRETLSPRLLLRGWPS